MLPVFIGYDPRLALDHAVCAASVRRHGGLPRALDLATLRAQGLYWRPVERRPGPDGKPVMWDTLSEAPMATEFAVSRFLVPHLAAGSWSLFMDSDMLVRRDLAALAALADDRYAVMAVRHHHWPLTMEKMDGQAQTAYPRKNWSSLMLVNGGHPAHARLTLRRVNETPGRELHAFCWLEDDEIGALPVEWNWLAGHSDPAIDPAIVHWTDGSPALPGFEAAPYADEWRAVRDSLQEAA